YLQSLTDSFGSLTFSLDNQYDQELWYPLTSSTPSYVYTGYYDSNGTLTQAISGRDLQLTAAATRGLSTSPAALASQQGIALWTEVNQNNISQTVTTTYTVDALGRETRLQTP